MKKKLIGGVISVMLCVGLLSGCGQDASTNNGSSTSNSATESQGEKELEGTIDEIKDFMFVVTDKNGTPYEFSFDKAPKGLKSIKEGDTVVVKYTGTVSEVDAFEGEVLSVEKK